MNAVERKKGVEKQKGCITGADSIQLGALLEILDFFDSWQISLQADSEGGSAWKDHFITDMSWFDMRATILGFVAMSRYIFSDEDLVTRKDGDGGRYLQPRMFSQVTSSLVCHFLGFMRSGYSFTAGVFVFLGTEDLLLSCSLVSLEPAGCVGYIIEVPGHVAYTSM